MRNDRTTRGRPTSPSSMKTSRKSCGELTALRLRKWTMQTWPRRPGHGAPSRTVDRDSLVDSRTGKTHASQPCDLVLRDHPADRVGDAAAAAGLPHLRDAALAEGHRVGAARHHLEDPLVLVQGRGDVRRLAERLQHGRVLRVQGQPHAGPLGHGDDRGQEEPQARPDLLRADRRVAAAVVLRLPRRARDGKPAMGISRLCSVGCCRCYGVSAKFRDMDQRDVCPRQRTCHAL